MKKRNIIRFGSFTAAAFLILGGFTVKGYGEAALYRRNIEYGYQYAFSELVSNVNALDAALQKVRYSESAPLISALSSEAYMRASAAQISISRLPLSEMELEYMSAFLTRAGDYSYYLSKKAAMQNGLTEDEASNLLYLSESASQLSYELSELQTHIYTDGLRLDALARADERLSAQNGAVSVGDTFKMIESEFPEFPTLIYDGPFSVHIDQARARQLIDEPVIDEAEAGRRAADFFGLNPSVLEYSGFSDGRIKTYMFSALADGGEMSVSVTQEGGKILNMFNSRAVKTARLTAEDAVSAAKEFLALRGFDNMRETYWSVFGNTAMINFAYVQDDVLCYPDFIRVSVALDNGRIVGYESHGYLMNHGEREIAAQTVDIEAAKAALSPELTLLSAATVIIPSGGMYEVLCHEFKCENADGGRYIKYVNAETGAEERILILIESDSGTLVI